jgi:eukaryotic-like serine/threonine-protein kinase
MAFIGQTLGHYGVIRLIGEGGMGQVYLANDNRLPRQVAIKIVRNELQPYANDEALTQAQRLFQREMRAISQLDHPHILSFYDFGEQAALNGTIIYMVMPYRPEGSLVDWLVKHGNSLLPVQDVAHIVTQAASALQHAHNRGIIHQDVKLSNFLVRDNLDQPDQPDLFLVDFGNVRILSTTSTVSSTIRGTYAYMAPEQWNSEVVPATDQYALAIMTYQLLTGRLPFQGRPEQMMYQQLSVMPSLPSSLNPHLSPAIDAVVLRALSKDATERFPSIRDFAIAFQQAITYSDLPTTLPISNTESHDGANRTITLPDKRQVSVDIPPWTQNGEELIIPNQGLPYYTDGPRGPLRLTITLSEDSQPSLSPTAQNVGADSEHPHKEPPHIPVTPTLPATNTTPAHAVRFPPTATYPAPTISANHISAATPKRAADHKTARRYTVIISTFVLVMIISSALLNGIIHSKTTAANKNITAIFNTDPYIAHSAFDFYDPLTAPFKWQNQHDNNIGGQCQFKNNAYEADQAVPPRHLAQFYEECNEENDAFVHFAFEVKMTIHAGDCGGISLKSIQNGANQYAFEVCQRGSYLVREVHFDTFTQNVLASGTYHSVRQFPILPIVSSTNTIAVVAHGNTIHFYINGSQQPVATIYASSLQQNLGLIAVAQTHSTNISYSDARLWTLTS